MAIPVHEDRMKELMNAQSQLSESVSQYINKNVLNLGASKLMAYIGGDKYLEYVDLYNSSESDFDRDNDFSTLTENQKLIVTYEQGEAYMCLWFFALRLKGLENRDVLLQSVSVGTGDLNPSPMGQIAILRRMYLDLAYGTINALAGDSGVYYGSL